MRTVGTPGKGVTVTLARHERKTAASTIIAKIKSKPPIKLIAEEFGVKVRYEHKPNEFEDLYEVPAERVKTTAARYFARHPSGYAK